MSDKDIKARVHIGFHRVSLWASPSPICAPYRTALPLIFTKKELRKVSCKNCLKMQKSYAAIMEKKK